MGTEVDKNFLSATSLNITSAITVHPPPPPAGNTQTSFYSGQKVQSRDHCILHANFPVAPKYFPPFTRHNEVMSPCLMLVCIARHAVLFISAVRSVLWRDVCALRESCLLLEENTIMLSS